MSCCSCGCNPCSCGSNIAPVTCCIPTTESVEYTFENGGLQGVGVFDNETDNLVQFRSIASDTLALTVTLDAPTKSIIISFNDELLIDDVPTFTETVRGIGEAATQVETNAGALDDKIITPLKLNDRTATETRTGIAEIATHAEVTTGTDDTRIVTPLKLATFAGTQATTRTFVDSVARGGATPNFSGQFGGQLDVDTAWYAYGTSAGNWRPLLTGGSVNTLNGLTTQLDGTAGEFIFSTFSRVWFVNTIIDWTGSQWTDYTGTLMPDASVVITEPATGGSPSSRPITFFLSAINEDSGWTNFSNSLVRKTGDCNTITLPQLAQVVDTLIQTLGTARLLPIP